MIFDKYLYLEVLRIESIIIIEVMIIEKYLFKIVRFLFAQSINQTI